MITSALHSSWIDDIPITKLSLVGLGSPSIIRFKLFSLDEALIISKLGKLSGNDIKQVSGLLKKYLIEDVS